MKNLSIKKVNLNLFYRKPNFSQFAENLRFISKSGSYSKSLSSLMNSMNNITKYSNEFCAVESVKKYLAINPNPDSAFFIANLDNVDVQINKWKQELPNIIPHYAVKCNPDLPLLKRMVDRGLSFDCASPGEIESVLNLGVSPDKIIFANPCKAINHIKYAKEKGVNLTTFDNEDELKKIAEYHPNCGVVMRIHVDDSYSVCQLGSKFGAREDSLENLVKKVKELNLSFKGISFHVGSGCSSSFAYYSAIEQAKRVFDLAELYGFDLKLLDIGGGFPGCNDGNISFEDISDKVRQGLDDFFSKELEDPEFKIISEPGRYFASSTYSLATTVTSKRKVFEKDSQKNMIYINDGIYGAFNCILFDHYEISLPKVLKRNFNDNSKDEIVNTSVWGPTCDSMDCISKNMPLPDLNINDVLIFEKMGAYSLAASSNFNGFVKSNILYFSRNEEYSYSSIMQKKRFMSDDFSLS